MLQETTTRSVSDLMKIVVENAEVFRYDFPQWLEENQHIAQRFIDDALVMARRVDHYSARTIIEYLRHETSLREAGGEFKINGNIVPDMARLFALAFPQYQGLFEQRNRTAKTILSGIYSAA